MNKIAKFEKVSFEQYLKDRLAEDDTIQSDVALEEWKNIKLPTRATTGSAGYDFYLPYDTTISFGRVVNTGIRCMIDDGWLLAMMPKSGLGFKHEFRLWNTIGVIDSDFADSDNEGHILLKCKTGGNFGMSTPLKMKAGQKFAQGIFLPFGITIDDAADGVRHGGFGSTGA